MAQQSMRTEQASASLLHACFAVLVAMVACLGSASAETVIEWRTKQYTGRYGGFINTRDFLTISGEANTVEAQYNRFKGITGRNPEDIAYRGLALRCPSDEGLGWYAILLSQRPKETNWQTDGVYSLGAESGAAAAVCGAASPAQAVDVVLSACEREPQCSSMPKFVVGLYMDGGDRNTVPSLMCESRASFNDLNGQCRSALTAAQADLKALGAEVQQRTGKSPPSAYASALVPPGPSPVVVAHPEADSLRVRSVAAAPSRDAAPADGPASALDAEASAALDHLVGRIQSRTLRVEVILLFGHADGSAPKSKVDARSLEHAESVKRLLVRRGLDPSAIYTEAWHPPTNGESERPAPAGALPNRVDLEFVGLDAGNSKVTEGLTLNFKR